MVVTCQQMREIEEQAFASGVTAADLMDEAGRGIAEVISQFHPKPGSLGLYLGKGNNAGDALVAARVLIEKGWQVFARLAFAEADFKPLPKGHWEILKNRLTLISRSEEIPERVGVYVLLDGLVGIGAEGPLGTTLSPLAEEMNALRQSRHARVIAMDIPSGLDGDTGEPHEVCVMADVTATVSRVKQGLLSDRATSCVGRLAVVPVAALDSTKPAGPVDVLTSRQLRRQLPRRPFDFHKGMAGRVGVIAGSKGFTGAAVLAATGALRGGAGLVTLFVKDDAYAAIAGRAPLESMVKCVSDYRDLISLQVDAWAVGPGLGFEHEAEILDLIREAAAPMVIDADALTMLGRAELKGLSEAKYPRLLTPHPGEMQRLIANRLEWQTMGRRDLEEAFSTAHPTCTLLLKGARTVIAEHGKPTAFNTTGSPGMASGGMGDLLTGVCAALLAQGVSAISAACIGAWVCGRAAEIALSSGDCSEETLLATDVAARLGEAFIGLQEGSF